MIKGKKAVLLADNAPSPIIEECATVLRRYRFSDDHVGQFTDEVVGILNDYAELAGESVEIEYRVAKKILGVELRLILPGERFDPLASGKNAEKRFFDNLPTLNLNTGSVRIAERYASGCNIISVSIPFILREKKLARDPIVLAIVGGILCGLLLQHVPQPICSFIIDELANPLLSIVLKLLGGIMGPVIFISMTTSILEFGSISELTDMGIQILRRFVRITLFILAVSLAVAAVLFVSFGEGGVDIVPNQVVGLLLNIMPTNLVQPFIDNNTPQLVILGAAIGSTLLMLGDRVKDLNAVLVQANECIMSLMSTVLVVIPAIPFLSIMMSVASGNFAQMLAGWKFILGSYIVFTIVIAAKALKASKKTGIGIPTLWQKIKPAVSRAFSTSSTSSAIKMAYDISEREFNIKPEFTSFWVPMCSALFSPKTTVYLVLATCMMAQSTGVAITIPFILVLVLVTMELSLASPGTTSSLVIMFETLAMPTTSVGLFSAYLVLTENYNAGVVEAYSLLELAEAAHQLGGIKGNTTDAGENAA